MESTFDPHVVLAAFQRSRDRIISLARDLDAESAATVVPTCPDWTVIELLRHVYGVEDDLAHGRLEGAGSDAWTAAQLARHADKDAAAICAAWPEVAAIVDAQLLGIPEPMNLHIVMDRVTHEHDLRLALGRPGARDDVAVAIGSARVLGMHRDSDPALVAQIEALDLEGFERFRSLTGRRSVAQMEAMGFPGAAFAARMAGSPMAVTTVDIIESPTA